MAKNKTVVADNGAPPKVYKLTGGIIDLLKGAGWSILWTAKPKGQTFVIGCLISPARRLAIVQQYPSGSPQLYEEVSEAQLLTSAGV